MSGAGSVDPFEVPNTSMQSSATVPAEVQYLDVPALFGQQNGCHGTDGPTTRNNSRPTIARSRHGGSGLCHVGQGEQGQTTTPADTKKLNAKRLLLAVACLTKTLHETVS